MIRAPEEEVARFMSFSHDSHGSLGPIRNFSHREWRRVLKWLDNSGLAFYFLQKIRDADAADVLPNEISSRLERDYASNQLRVENLKRRFAALNMSFDNAGLGYAVVKGFSLIPDFCPSAALRYQGDFDYLIESDSLPKANRVLLDAGYVTKQSVSSKEHIFVIPGIQPSRDSVKVADETPHAVELHTDMWDTGLHGVPLLADLFSVKAAVTRHWNGLKFLALPEEESFLLQVIHACHHLFTLWMRMSNVFEMAYFLNRRANDAAFWSRVERRVGPNATLREFVTIVLELAAQLFGAPLPPLVQSWSAALRPGARVWIDHYARRWAFCELPVYEFTLFPRSKLALFLRQQYEDGSSIDKSEHGSARPPISRLARMAAAIRSDPGLVFNRTWWSRQLLIQRGMFRFLSRVRYVCEIPRWWWLNRTRVRTASP